MSIATKRHRRARSYFLGASIACASLLLAAACSGSSNESPPGADGTSEGESLPVSIAVYPGLFLELPVYAAERSGIFDEVGLDAEIVQIAGGPNQAAAVQSGDMDAFVFPVNSVLPLRAQGQNFEAVVNIQGPAIYTVIGEKDAVAACPTANDPYPGPLECLRDQPVGVAQLGGDSFVVFMTMLADAGMSQDDMDLVAVGASSNLANAFQADQIKFAIGVEPAPTMLEHSLGITTNLVSLAGNDVGTTFDPWIGETMWAMQSALDSDPETFNRLREAISQATDWIQDPANKDTVISIMVDDMGLDEQTAAALTENSLSTFTAEFDCAGFENVQNFAVDTDALADDQRQQCADVLWEQSASLLVNQ